jgi:hypothetical protein
MAVQEETGRAHSTELVRMDSAEIARACEREATRLGEVARERRRRAQLLWDEADQLDAQITRLRAAYDTLGATAPPGVSNGASS